MGIQKMGRTTSSQASKPIQIGMRLSAAQTVELIAVLVGPANREVQPVLASILVLDKIALEQPGAAPSGVEREDDLVLEGGGRQHGADPELERIHPLPGQRGYRHHLRHPRGSRLQGGVLVGREPVDLVPDLEHGLLLGLVDAEIAKDGPHILRLMLRFRMGNIAHMQDEIRLEHFFEGGAKGGDELGREIGDEADRVREDRPRSGGSSIARMVGSSVAKTMSFARMPEPVRMLKSVDLPAFV